ncbi:hypothetical protein IEO21_03699 [Rhodonia placenta]|uniref:Uncharacterized protein n=1 Tax=Rhodonia placenta TaxID=104341 RepID=A0A8H7U3Y5_9APHY|nr:hypothetical protein IEO21_03699 [Postia placenta]
MFSCLRCSMAKNDCNTTISGDAKVGDIFCMRESLRTPFEKIFEDETFGEGYCPRSCSTSTLPDCNTPGLGKDRPCLISDVRQKEGLEPAYEIYVMGTFGGASLAELPYIYRHFSLPVAPNGLHEEHIHTIPGWRVKHGNHGQFLVVYGIGAKHPPLVRWHARGSNFGLRRTEAGVKLKQISIRMVREWREMITRKDWMMKAVRSPRLKGYATDPKLFTNRYSVLSIDEGEPDDIPANEDVNPHSNSCSPSIVTSAASATTEDLIFSAATSAAEMDEGASAAASSWRTTPSRSRRPRAKVVARKQRESFTPWLIHAHSAEQPDKSGCWEWMEKERTGQLTRSDKDLNVELFQQ